MRGVREGEVAEGTMEDNSCRVRSPTVREGRTRQLIVWNATAALPYGRASDTASLQRRRAGNDFDNLASNSSLARPVQI